MYDPIPLPEVLRTFAHGFAFGRSFTHPYLAEKIGPAWWLHDAPRKKAADYRNEEWIFPASKVRRVDAEARRRVKGRFSVSPVFRPQEDSSAAQAWLKSKGYRQITTEPLMVHDLRGIEAAAPPAGIVIKRVADQDLADRLAKAARSRQVLPEHLQPSSPLRQYVALRGRTPIGWVRSIVTGKTTWVSNMFVETRFRRRGIARAMLRHLLRDDRAAGSRASILSASTAGTKLYEVVGYRALATLILFVPRRT